MSTIDPTTWATQLATAYTQGTQGLITQQTKAATATSTALSTLKSALSAFSSTLAGLSTKKTLLANSATVSDTSKATASATASASAGTYSFFVKQLASAHQVMYSPVPSVSASGAGTLIISQAGGSSYSVDLSGADTDGDGAVSQTELARAINSATSGKVTASVVASGGSSNLMLTAADTGAAGAISLDTSGVGDGTLAAALSSPTELAAAQDAIFNIGTETTGITVQQASNSYTGISGLSVTFSQAMASGSSPLTVDVAADNTAVTSKVQQFVDAYNAMRDKLDSLTATSLDSSKRGAFATDAGVRSLKNTLTSVLRQSFGGATLRDLGVQADRYGKLSLDSSALADALTADPTVVDSVFGYAATSSSSGVLGAMDTALDGWLDITSGQITRRQDIVDRQQTSLETRQTRLDAQYNAMYERYLVQFTQLQSLTSQLENSTSLFSQLGG